MAQGFIQFHDFQSVHSQEFWKRTIPDYLIEGTDYFSFNYSIKYFLMRSKILVIRLR